MQKFGAELVLKDQGFSKKISTASDKVNKFGRATTKGSRSVGQLDSKMKSSTGSVKRWIAGFVGIAAITMGLRSASTTFMEFDDTIRMVGAVSKATDTELIQLSDTAKRLGATTAWTASQVGQGMKYMGMAGFDANQTMAAMPGLLSLASASQTDLATASDIVSDALTMFGMKAKQAGELSDIMARAATDSNTTVTMLGEAYKYVGSTAYDMGQGIKETTAMLEVLASAGQKGSKGGVILAQMLEAISKQAKDGRLNIGGYSVAMADSNGNFLDAMDVIGGVKKALEKLTPVQKKAALGELFSNVRAKRAASILMRNTDQYEKKLWGLVEAHGAADEMAGKMEAGMGGAWRRVKSAAEDVSISMGQMHSPALMSGMELVISTLGSVSRNVGSLSQLVASGAIAWGIYIGAQKLMVLWSQRQAIWSTIVAVKQGGLTKVLKSGTAQMMLLTAGAYAWINVAKEMSDVNTAAGNDIRLLTNSWSDFGAVMKKVGAMILHTYGRVLNTIGLISDEQFAAGEKDLFKYSIDVDERSAKAKIGRYSTEFIKKQQDEAKKQLLSGEKKIDSALKSMDFGKIDIQARDGDANAKDIVRVIGDKTKFSSAFDVGGGKPEADYSISSRKIAEKSEGDSKISRVESSRNGTQNNTFNFYDVGKKSLEELMAEFVPEFKKVCQNMG